MSTDGHGSTPNEDPTEYDPWGPIGPTSWDLTQTSTQPLWAGDDTRVGSAQVPDATGGARPYSQPFAQQSYAQQPFAQQPLAQQPLAQQASPVHPTYSTQPQYPTQPPFTQQPYSTWRDGAPGQGTGQGRPEPRRGGLRRPAIIALVGLLVVALGAAGVMAWPMISRLVLPGQGLFKDAAGASYLNGATREWTLELKTALPELSDPRFTFGPNLDDASSPFRFGVIDGGDVWLAGIRAAEARYVIGIEAASGRVLWKVPTPEVVTCQYVAASGSFACLETSGSRSTSTVEILDAHTGTMAGRVEIDGSNGFLVVSGDTIVAATSSPRLVSYGLDSRLTTRWTKDIGPSEAGFTDVAIPMEESDGLVVMITSERSAVVDTRSGEVVLSGEGRIDVAPERHLLTHQGFSAITPASSSVSVVSGYVATQKDGAGRWGLFQQGPAGLSWCTRTSPITCTQLAGGPYTSVDSAPIEGAASSYAMLTADTSYALVSLIDGRVAGTFDGRTTSYSVFGSGGAAPGPVVVTGDGHGGQISLIDPASGAVVARGALPTWHPLPVLPGRIVLMRAPTLFSGSADAIASYAPATSATPDLESAPGTNVAAPAASGLPECPAGTNKLASAVFSDGWVLVCGLDAGHPSYWSSSVAGKASTSSTVTIDSANQRYLARWPDASTGWLSYAPGMVGFADAQGHLTASRSDGQIWFVDRGAATSGSFGVPVPQATANDQVRYLSQLLVRSAQARAALQPAVVSVHDCLKGSAGDYSAEVAVIDSVTSNRGELIAALQAAPVDQVPNGLALVNQLIVSLSYSQQADQAFAEWARAIDLHGCGTASDATAQALSVKAGEAKTAFVTNWNSTIAPSFGVPTVTRETL